MNKVSKIGINCNINTYLCADLNETKSMKKIFIALFFAVCSMSCATTQQSNAEVNTPQQAIDRLIEGNNRYVTETSTHQNNSQTRRTETAPHQEPFVAIVSCSDSRVPVELIFDQGIGDIFTIRSAGNNVNGKMIMGSIEYAVEHLGVKAIIVLGHESCGGVTGAITGGEHHGAIGELLHTIANDIPEFVGKPEELHNATVAHTNAQVEKILENPVVAECVANGKTIVKAAFYDIHTGKVQF